MKELKNVLIVVYPWPPAGGPGVQRCLKFTKYLPEFGWRPIVLTAKNPDVSAKDDSLAESLSKDLKVHSTKKLEPYDIYRRITCRKPNEMIPVGQLKNAPKATLTEKLSAWVRANIFIPDAKIGWKPYAVAEGLRIIQNQPIGLIYSSGPPHTAHLIARSLSQHSGIRWIADFRDPWIEIDYYDKVNRTSLSLKLDRYLENKCIRSCHAMTTVSNGLVQLLSSKPGAPECHLLPNGFDEDDFQDSETDKAELFTIYYGGSLSLDRIPHRLIEALAEVKAAYPKHQFKLQLAGFACPEFQQIIKKFKLESNYEDLGYLSHKAATKQLLKADILLLSINNVSNNRGIVTGKIFEYMGAKRPILGIGPIDGDAANLIRETNSGRFFDYTDQDGMVKFIEHALLKPKTFCQQFTFNTASYSRQNLTRRLAEIFNKQLSD